MAYPNQETEVRALSQGADSFVSWYYQDLNEGRSIAPYYVNSSQKYTTAGITADVTINGGHLTDPSQYEVLLEQQRRSASNASNANGAANHNHKSVRYDPTSYDAQVLNNDYGLACPANVLSKGADSSGARISMLLTVTGTLHLGNGPEMQHVRFHEVFVLVPNWDVVGRRNPPRNAKKFLISSQNYRTL
jgi:NTF2-related export protein 1/2